MVVSLAIRSLPIETERSGGRQHHRHGRNSLLVERGWTQRQLADRHRRRRTTGPALRVDLLPHCQPRPSLRHRRRAGRHLHRTSRAPRLGRRRMRRPTDLSRALSRHQRILRAASGLTPSSSAHTPRSCAEEPTASASCAEFVAISWILASTTVRPFRASLFIRGWLQG